MTLLQIRQALRRQIRDVPSVQWDTDGDLDTLVINPAYYLLQKEVYKQFPHAHLSWDRMDTEANEPWYPLPATFGIKAVTVLNPADGTYTKLARKDYENIKGLSLALSEQYYTQQGQYFGIFPAPDSVVTDGIELLHSPIQSLSEDTDIPRIKLPLHIAIVWWAKLIALGDTDEESDVTRARLQELLGDLGNWYELHGDDPDRLQVVY